jgi:hypothetical protein
LAGVKPDAAIISGVEDVAALQELARPLGTDVPWGPDKAALTEEDAKALEEAGCGLLAVSLSGATVAALGSEEVARVLHVNSDVDLDQLRAIDALPVDVLLVSIPRPSTPWTLEDLANVARVGRRVEKYVLVQLPGTPAAKELEAIRDAGVNGLVMEVEQATPQGLSDLKAALLDMPRHRPRTRERAVALLSSPAISAPPGAAPEPSDPDEDDE